LIESIDRWAKFKVVVWLRPGGGIADRISKILKLLWFYLSKIIIGFLPLFSLPIIHVSFLFEILP
jgi:hypothetical protein